MMPSRPNPYMVGALALAATGSAACTLSAVKPETIPSGFEAADPAKAEEVAASLDQLIVAANDALEGKLKTGNSIKFQLTKGDLTYIVERRTSNKELNIFIYLDERTSTRNPVYAGAAIGESWKKPLFWAQVDGKYLIEDLGRKWFIYLGNEVMKLINQITTGQNNQ